MAFPNENKTLTGKDGQSISNVQSIDKTSYPTFDIDYYGYWVINDGVSIPVLRDKVKGIKFQDIPIGDIYPTVDISLTGKDGANLTLEESKQEENYPTFDFEDTWTGNNGIYGPILTNTIEVLESGTRKNYIEVVESVYGDGTMFYNSKWYKYVKTIQSFALAQYDIGTEIEHLYGGDEMFVEGQEYMYLASGITDKTQIGGMWNYTDETSRTITIIEEHGMEVNFYYTKPPHKGTIVVYVSPTKRLRIRFYSNNSYDYPMKINIGGTVYCMNVIPATETSIIRITDGISSYEIPCKIEDYVTEFTTPETMFMINDDGIITHYFGEGDYIAPDFIDGVEVKGTNI